MKKIMFLLLMCVGFLSSLFALDTGQMGIYVEKRISINVAIAAVSPIEGVDHDKVDIRHKDTLMYGQSIGLDKGLNLAATSASMTQTIIYKTIAGVHKIIFFSAEGERGV